CVPVSVLFRSPTHLTSEKGAGRSLFLSRGFIKNDPGNPMTGAGEAPRPRRIPGSGVSSGRGSLAAAEPRRPAPPHPLPDPAAPPHPWPGGQREVAWLGTLPVTRRGAPADPMANPRGEAPIRPGGREPLVRPGRDPGGS